MNITMDFETYSECDIFKAGAYAYADHDTTEVLCLAWALGDESPALWTPDMPLPQRLFDLIEQGATVWAWNSFFEMSIWNQTLGWPSIPISQWRDSAALAAAQAYPRALGKCGDALGLSGDDVKSKRGKLLIQRLCKPYRGERRQDPDMFKELCDYCIQDVVAEREIRTRLRNLRGSEVDVWITDQVINWRGVRLDKESINNALDIIEQHTIKSNKRIYELTGGAMDSTGSRAKATAWVAEQGYTLTAYDKATIAAALDDPKSSPIVREFLKIRQSLSRTSTKKFEAMLKCLGQDGRAHGVLTYHGAATGRWVGRHFQPQNLPRPNVDDVDAVIELMRQRDPDVIDGDPMDALASCLRGMLISSDGNRLVVADYSSIEARVLAWLSDSEDVLDVFRSGRDIYKATASNMYGIAYSDINYDQRFVGKVATLALGYQGGVKAFQKMSEAYGAEVTESQALTIRNDWREANPNIVKLWSDVERAAKNAVSYGTEFETCKGSFKLVNGDLLFKLPSKRILSFPNAKIQPSDRGVELVYEGMNNHIHKWGQIKAYGGSLVQSITQAVARDVLAEAVLRLENADYPVVLHVHDEIIGDVPNDHGSLAEFEALMCELPKWAKGLPVTAEGYESKRYRK